MMTGDSTPCCRRGAGARGWCAVRGGAWCAGIHHTSRITQAPPCGATSAAHLPEQPRRSRRRTRRSAAQPPPQVGGRAAVGRENGPKVPPRQKKHLVMTSAFFGRRVQQKLHAKLISISNATGSRCTRKCSYSCLSASRRVPRDGPPAPRSKSSPGRSLRARRCWARASSLALRVYGVGWRSRQLTTSLISPTSPISSPSSAAPDRGAAGASRSSTSSWPTAPTHLAQYIVVGMDDDMCIFVCNMGGGARTQTRVED